MATRPAPRRPLRRRGGGLSRTPTRVGAEQALAFRLARHHLSERQALSPADAATCPLSDVSRGAGLMALAARSRDVTRSTVDAAVDDGSLVLAPTLRAALHMARPGDWGSLGRALIADRDDELLAQLGGGAQRHLESVGITAGDALAEVASAVTSALADGRALSRDELHEALRHRVREELLPWCRGCGSHHVSPMLWRYAGVRAGMRMTSTRRFRADSPPDGQPERAVRCFLRHHGPSTRQHFGAWAGLATSHARRLWARLEPELVPVDLNGHPTWLLAADEPVLASPPRAEGIRLLPPRDAYVQQPDRATLVPDAALRRRLFRPLGDPGAVLSDGRLAGLWRARLRGRRLEITVEPLARLPRAQLEQEAERLAHVREAAPVSVVWA